MALSERILLAIKHADPDVRLLAFEEASQSPDPDTLALCIEGLIDACEKVRLRCRELLCALTGVDLGDRKEGWREWWVTYAARRCARCAKPLFSSPLYYRARLSLTSEPKELFLTQEDLTRDHQGEIDRLVAELKNRPPEEVEEEVFVHLDYYLCIGCKKIVVREARDGTR